MTKIKDIVSLSLSIINKLNQKVLQEEKIDEILRQSCLILSASEEDYEKAKKILYSTRHVNMDRGVYLKDSTHTPWYYAFKQNIDTFPFWDSYKEYLLSYKSFSPSVVDALDNSTDDIMDMLADPNNEHFSRKGLVIGDVQSGKTATYLALINKASDAGYKVIILLTGIIEKLRQQTQERVDEGFIGFNLIGNNKCYIGTGCYNHIVDPISFTSISSDFNKKISMQVSATLRSFNSPVIFVIKKNKSVLEQLTQWLTVNNTENIKDQPMLLIDDEADMASINTKNPDFDPTAINVGIRKLLKVFSRSNYVAFTATPYANIFINPNSIDEMLGDDLFPKDFIYCLNSPSNYIGASTIFLDEYDGDTLIKPARHKYMLSDNSDCENYIPTNHDKFFVPNELPYSLKEAVASFIIGNAVRDLRGHDKTHRTMLVNISRLINVQNKLTELINTYLNDIKLEIKNYYKMGEQALEHKHIKFLYDIYITKFKSLQNNKIDNIQDIFSWDEIQDKLYYASASIKAVSINGGNASKELNYDGYKENGLRLIAVGGLSLSRGLTLEGLMVSYFYRNSRMYDTLMQMGRWFGYRNNYEDLCQIWMTEQSQNWYAFIAEATNELKNEIKIMHNQNKTPSDFGLQVRSSSDVLLVTAMNKMRDAARYEVVNILSGTYFETPFLTSNKLDNNKNRQLIDNFINNILVPYSSLNTTKQLVLKNDQFLDVPKDIIVDFLDKFIISDYNEMLFNSGNDYVKLFKENHDSVFDKWDIIIARGENTLKGNDYINRPVNRNFSIEKNNKGEISAFKMSAGNKRLGTSNDSKGGLDESDVIAIEKEIKQIKDKDIKNLSSKDYFKTKVQRNPLLIIYPVKLKPRDNFLQDIAYEYNKIGPLFGIGIGIPVFQEKFTENMIYAINHRKQQELNGTIYDDLYNELDEIEDGQ